MEPVSIDPNRPMTVTLPAQQWNVVTYALAKHPMPFEQTAPVLNGIGEQLRAQATGQLTTEEMQAKVDGGEHAHASVVPERSDRVPDTAGERDDHDAN